MRFSIIAFVASIMAGQALAGTVPVEARADAFSNFANGVGAKAQAASPNAGQPCKTGLNQILNEGTCTTVGICQIIIPPNETDNVKSDDC